MGDIRHRLSGGNPFKYPSNKFPMLAEIIKKIRKDKRIGLRKLSARTGIRADHLQDKRVERATLATLIRICDGLGVELSIIDGWKKYKLNNFRGLPEIDLLFDEMNTMPSEDRYIEKKEEELAKARWAELAKKQTYCRGCKHCIPTIEKEGIYWCSAEGDYVIRRSCVKRDERDIPQVFRKQDVR